MDKLLVQKVREAEIQINKLKAANKLERKLRRDAEQELSLMQARTEFWDAIASGYKPSISVRKRLTVKTPGTAWLLKSDWHVGQRVDPAACGGHNKFNMKICRARVKESFENDIKLLEALRKLTNIKECVVWLGGDIITGDIHDDLKESNEKQPVEQAVAAKEMIIDGLNYLHVYGGFDHIHVVCNMGNHGRTTHEKRFSTAAANSYEFGMYLDLATLHYKHTDWCSWSIARGQTLITECQGLRIRTQHGDKIKYRGGIGGLTIPLLKAIYRINKSDPCDHDIIGDKHTWMPNPRYTVNGSLLGFTEYADGSFEVEEPCQGLLVFAKGKKTPVHQEQVYVNP
jgi:hypothetical protein